MKNRNWIRALVLGLAFSPALAAYGQAPALQLNVIYQCAGNLSAKVFSCTGNNPTDTCDVQNYRDGKSAQRGMMQRQMLVFGLAQCHLQTAEEAKAHPAGPDLAPGTGTNQARTPGTTGTNAAASTNQVGLGGFHVGDTVRYPLGEAKILQVKGSDYFVRTDNGVEIWMNYPQQIKRLGKLTPQDHAAGQWDVRDPVEVLIQGQGWMAGKVVRQSDNVFTIELANGHDVDSEARWMRMPTSAPAMAPSTAAPAAAATKSATATQAGAPPKGMVSCAGKFEGRYSSSNSAGGMLSITFRSGKASVREPDMVMTNGKLSAMSSEKEAECFTGGGKIFLRWLDGTNFDFPIDINNDGTLDTPYGELKKKAD